VSITSRGFHREPCGVAGVLNRTLAPSLPSHHRRLGSRVSHRDRYSCFEVGLTPAARHATITLSVPVASIGNSVLPHTGHIRKVFASIAAHHNLHKLI